MATHLHRRSVLGIGLMGGFLAGVGVAGCRYTDPVIHSSNVQTPTPQPTPAPDQLKAAADELAVAAAASWLATAAGVPTDTQRWAASVATAHATASAVLSEVDPLTATVETPAPVTPGTFADAAAALAAIRSSSATLASAHLQTAEAAEGAPLSLLYLSLAITSVWQQRAGTPVELRPLQPRTFTTDVPTARGVLIEQLHAAIQAYEIGLGLLRTGDARLAPARARLAALTRLRDEQNALVRSQGGTPPGPRPGYRLPLQPTNPGTAGQLFGLVERSVLAAFCTVTAATAAAERPALLKPVLTHTAAATAWGTPMPQWPGWG